MKLPIYLDYASTTPIDGRVVEKMKLDEERRIKKEELERKKAEVRKERIEK